MSLDLKEEIQHSDHAVEHSAASRDGPRPLDVEELKRERAVVWKLDLYVAPLVFLLQFVSNIDKGNIGFAATQGMAEDIHLQGNQLNACVSIFYVLYILVEVPAALTVKRIGFHKFVPCIVFLWGLVCLFTGFVQSYGGLMAARLFLGATEGCLFPSLSIFLLNWYRREEMGLRIFMIFGKFPWCITKIIPLLADSDQARRLSQEPSEGCSLSPFFTWTAWLDILDGAGMFFSSSCVSCCNHMTDTRGCRLYIIEGLITVVVSIACVFVIPKSYETAWFLTTDDKRIMRRRAELAEAYSGGNGHYKWKDIKMALMDPKVYVSGVCQHTSIIVLYGKQREI